jgi:molybdopterin adenylyltransferase
MVKSGACVKAVCLSREKGVAKKEQSEAFLIAGHGLEGDAHAGPWHRQVSLLAQESVDKMIAKGLELFPGDFGENLTTEGIEVSTLPIGTRLRVGEDALLEVTQIGKKCHHGCAIYQQVGDCIMPREGIFTRVLISGKVKAGDAITIEQGYRLAIVTASDKGARGQREDESAKVIRDLTSSLGSVIDYTVLPDDEEAISNELKRLADERAIDIVFTTRWHWLVAARRNAGSNVKSNRPASAGFGGSYAGPRAQEDSPCHVVAGGGRYSRPYPYYQSSWQPASS